MRLAHFFSDFSTLGGVQSVLRYQLERDPAYGFESELFVYDEETGPATDRVHYVGPKSYENLSLLRSRMRRRLAGRGVDVAVYHGGAGAIDYADLDGAKRRIQILHGDGPGLREFVLKRAPLVDGILCVSEPLQARVRAQVPEWDPRRVALLPYPIHPMAQGAQPRSLANRTLVIGYAGRLQKVQKRVERLPAFVRALDAQGVDFRFELLGDGPDSEWLKSEFSQDPRVVFLGRKVGAAYWEVLRHWDVTIYVSQYEGLPIAMLESLSQATLPVFPKIGTGGDQYAARVDPGFVYASGDVNEAASAVARISRMDDVALDRLRSQCLATVQPHLGDGYMEQFSAFVRELLALPRVSDENARSRSLLMDLCPYYLRRKLDAIEKKRERQLPPEADCPLNNQT